MPCSTMQWYDLQAAKTRHLAAPDDVADKAASLWASGYILVYNAMPNGDITFYIDAYDERPCIRVTINYRMRKRTPRMRFYHALWAMIRHADCT